MEVKVHPWVRGSRVAELASLMNTALVVRLFLERGVVLNELVLESGRITVACGRIGVHYLRICIVDHIRKLWVSKTQNLRSSTKSRGMLKRGNVLHCDNNTSAANVETVRKLKFWVLSHPTYVQLPLEDMFHGLLLAHSGGRGRGPYVASHGTEKIVCRWLRVARGPR